MESTRTVKLPGKHALDWFARCGDAEEEYVAEVTAQTARTVTLRLNDAALRDLISDSTYYVEEMGPDNTGDPDWYRPAARRCLAALERLGVRWTVDRNFRVTLEEN